MQPEFFSNQQSPAVQRISQAILYNFFHDSLVKSSHHAFFSFSSFAASSLQGDVEWITVTWTQAAKQYPSLEAISHCANVLQ